ncbi:hypothetical protein NW759_013982 [Fusarium solani]|nr:hypothetical protein NW759_013982 [Fusarium solani]
MTSQTDAFIFSNPEASYGIAGYGIAGYGPDEPPRGASSSPSLQGLKSPKSPFTSPVKSRDKPFHTRPSRPDAKTYKFSSQRVETFRTSLTGPVMSFDGCPIQQPKPLRLWARL